ncbi:MAG: FKBP-type peptidyl-prolyl cis-trans isomerase [Chitinophagaceae bacterium]|nr:FKBP-type peptidyl-prolyl cis-trans isomerase [Chitinophagaceae bacterium]MCB9046141.1 FKBP-type peptidyl-prolyl cis-trans isomerase [Chitinophagales bacterium]
MRYFQYIVTCFICFSLFSCSSTKKVAVKDVPFQTTQSGIKYKIPKDAKGKNYPQEGNYVEIFIKTYSGDSLIFNSREQTGGKPVNFPVSLPRFHGDLSEVFPLMTPGDSGIFMVSVDTLKANKQNLQPWMKEGEYITYSIELVSVKTQEQLDKERAEKAKESGDPEKEDKTLNAYFKKHKVTPKKRPSGMYYLVTKATDGEKPISGQKVKVKYTGKLMDGTVFDSNEDKDPFEFILGRGQVIRGWDEGIALLKKGEKATLYIPSYLAYGENSPSPKIPANSALIFDVELVDF